MNRISWKGIALGGLVDVVTSLLLVLPVIVFVALEVGHRHLSKLQKHDAFIAINAGFPMRATTLLIGSACCLLGGYIAAKIADHDEVLNGGLSSAFGKIVALIVAATEKDAAPHWLRAIYFVSGVVFAFLGGYLRLRQKQALLEEQTQLHRHQI
jgi:hypothetical protein